MNKLTLVALSFIVSIISGCSDANSCEGAKAEVVKYMNQYMKSLMDGKTGLSAPGGGESLAALAIAQKNCNNPNLTVKEILNEKK